MKCGFGAFIVAILLFSCEAASASEVSAAPQSAAPVDVPATAARAHRVFFEGVDSNGSLGLWYTLGTNATTIEVGGLNGAGIVATKFQFPVASIAAFGGGILFAGNDSAGGYGYTTNSLWISDGTAKGTAEIGRLRDHKVKGAASGGLAPSDIVPFGNHHAIFGGTKANSQVGLWATDGTAAGTVNLDLAKGAYASGLQSLDGAAWQSSFIFEGKDEYGYYGLWLSDGSIAGTTEIGGLRNAGIGGVGASEFFPTDFYPAGSLCYFLGVDSTGSKRLWVSNGTPNGTTEIGGVQNAGIMNLIGYDVGVSGVVIGGKLLFAGGDVGTVGGC